MEICASKGWPKEDTEEIAAFLGDLVDEIVASDRVMVSLSEATVEVFNRQYSISHNSPTGDMTLVVSWKRDRPNKGVSIDEKRFTEIAVDVQSEWSYGGLVGTMYEEFALECARRCLAEVEG